MVWRRLVVVVESDPILDRAVETLVLLDHASKSIIFVAEQRSGWIDSTRKVIAVRELESPESGVWVVDLDASAAAIMKVVPYMPECVGKLDQFSCRIIPVRSGGDLSLPIALYDSRCTT